MCEEQEQGQSKNEDSQMNLKRSSSSSVGSPLCDPDLGSVVVPGDHTLQMENTGARFGEMSTVANVISPDCVRGL